MKFHHLQRLRVDLYFDKTFRSMVSENYTFIDCEIDGLTHSENGTFRDKLLKLMVFCNYFASDYVVPYENQKCSAEKLCNFSYYLLERL